MGVVVKAHLIYGYKINGERMIKMWHNFSEKEYEKLVMNKVDKCKIIYGYDNPEYLGIELAYVAEDDEPKVLSQKFHTVSSELKNEIKNYAAKAFGEPDIAEPEYFLACLSH